MTTTPTRTLTRRYVTTTGLLVGEAGDTVEIVREYRPDVDVRVRGRLWTLPWADMVRTTKRAAK